MSRTQDWRQRGVKLPLDLDKWISDSAKKSVRSVTGEIVYKLQKLKEIESNAKTANNNQQA